MKKKTKKYNNGGDLASALAPDLVGLGLNAALPGLGTVVSPLIDMALQKSKQSKILQDHFNSMSQSTNPYGNYEKGGEIASGYEDLIKYSGDSHSAPSGGINVDQSGLPTPESNNQVEAGEVTLRVGNKGFVFSKKLII